MMTMRVRRFTGPGVRGLIDVAPGAISFGMVEGARRVRVAHVQDQGLRAVRASRGNRGRSAVRCGGARREGLGRRRPRRRRHQAARRPARTGPVGRVPNARGVSPGGAGVLRPRVCEERSGEPSAQGTVGAAVAGKRVSGAGRSRSRGRAGRWRDNRGGMR